MIFDPDRPWRSDPTIPERLKHHWLRQEQNAPPDEPDHSKTYAACRYGLPWPFVEGTAEEHFKKQHPKRSHTLADWELARMPSAVVRDILADISVRPEFNVGK